ncbi:unnamed protein product [Urochloa humidicola]
MDCSKKKASAVGDLPEGPLMDILSRVPAKSICRFKCVSKAWLDLITDPHHRKKLPQAMQGLFCQATNTSEDDLSYDFSFVDLVPRAVPLDIDPSFSFLTQQPEIQFIHFMDSCNGLILFEHCQEPHSDKLGYIVCNPTTKEWKHVPACGSLTLSTYPYLAFDPAVSSHFHLIQFHFQVDDRGNFLSVHAYSSETGAWTDNQIDEKVEEGLLEGWHQFSFLLGNCQPCRFVNGFLHLIVYVPKQNKIVVVDVQGKARRTMPVPSRGMFYFGESQGKLHYMTAEKLNTGESECKLSIWVLQDYDAHEWMLKGTVNTNDVFRGNNSRDGTKEFEVVDIHQQRNVVFFNHYLEHKRVGIRDGRAVMIVRSWEHKLVAYNMDNKEVSTIATFDDQEFLLYTARYVPYF